MSAGRTLLTLARVEVTVGWQMANLRAALIRSLWDSAEYQHGSDPLPAPVWLVNGRTGQ